MIDFRKWLVQAGLDEEKEIKGISEEEINSIEKMHSIRLPETYKDFLRQCGRSAGLFARDINFFYDDILYIKDNFIDSLEDWKCDFQPPKNAFYFSSYLAGSYHYFICDGSDNPAIWGFDETNLSPKAISPGFFEYMRSAISGWQDVFYDHPDKSWLQP